MLPVSLLVLIAYPLAGLALSEALRRRLDPPGSAAVRGPWERALWGGLFGAALLIATSWALALTRLLRPVPILLLGGGALAFGLSHLIRHRSSLTARLQAPGPAQLGYALLGVEMAVWLAFVLWRGQLMPITGNDALAYHGPKALLLAREHGYAFFPTSDARISTWPANYELLLSVLLLLDGTDRHWAWLGAWGFVLLLTAAGALAERWWGRGSHVLPAAALTASMPVALLHAGAIKNDLLTNVLFLAALLAASELAVRPSRFPLLALVVACGLALGTKVSAWLLCAAVAPLLCAGLLRLGRDERGPALRLLSGAFLATAVLGGGAVYAFNEAELGRALAVPALAAGRYGDLSNLWTVPYLLFAAPFSKTPHAVWAPWSHGYWFWEKYDLYSSHLGWLVSASLLLLPWAPALLRRSRARDLRELKWGSAAAVATFALLLPMSLRPVGFFCTFTRFLLFIGPVIAAWTVVPLTRALFAAGGWRRWPGAAVGGLMLGGFALEAVECAQYDVSMPLEAVRACLTRGDCAPRFSGGRACFALDRVAQRHDAVAVDMDFDAWLYPCFGGLDGRTVHFLRNLSQAPGPIPGDAAWVAVDRMQQVTWGHPGFSDFGHFFEFVGKGKPSEEDLRTAGILSADSGYRRVFRNQAKNQVVFQRVGPPAVHGRTPTP